MCQVISTKDIKIKQAQFLLSVSNRIVEGWETYRVNINKNFVHGCDEIHRRTSNL